VKSARKQAHFIELCDCFHIPIIFFVDAPGFMIGKESEEAAILREGARAAEKLAYALCRPGATLHHLIVVPELWKGMMGDDWLNNASTRAKFGRYVESQLEQEIRAHVKRMRRETTKRRIRYRYELVQGKPTECLIARAADGPSSR